MSIQRLKLAKPNPHDTKPLNQSGQGLILSNTASNPSTNPNQKNLADCSQYAYQKEHP